MPDPAIDIEKYLDSLSIEELRSFAKIGISITLRCAPVAINSLSKLLLSEKKNTDNLSAPEHH